MTHCPLTGIPFGDNVEFFPTENRTLKYKFQPVGVVLISEIAITVLERNPHIDRHLLAGICRNAFENGEQPVLIKSETLRLDLTKHFKLPITKNEKAYHLLKLIYKKGGNDLGKFKFADNSDRFLTYSKDHQEFAVIIEYLRTEHYINILSTKLALTGSKIFSGVSMTRKGIDRVKESLPKIPMIGLLDQEIKTGRTEIDEQIMHARKLFFDSESKENKRSACETLSYVLEPLRKDLNEFFLNKDVSDFFNIVNNFDIRHNKEHTKTLEHPEQLEWVFYSLLNTINTFVKLKNSAS